MQWDRPVNNVIAYLILGLVSVICLIVLLVDTERKFGPASVETPTAQLLETSKN